MAAARPEQQVNAFFERKKWKAAQRVIERALENLPEDAPIRHWWLSRLSAALYEQHQYADALENARLAESINPKCPLVLWDMANALDMLGKEREAIAVYSRILARKAHAIARDDCGEGLAKAQGLIADCKYRLSLCHADLGDGQNALRYAQEFLKDLLRGAAGIFTLDDLRKLLEVPFRIRARVRSA